MGPERRWHLGFGLGAFLEWSAAHDLVVHLLDTPHGIRRDRVRQRNREKGATFPMEVPAAFFELASEHWEPMDPTECEIYDVRQSPGIQGPLLTDRDTKAPTPLHAPDT